MAGLFFTVAEMMVRFYRWSYYENTHEWQAGRVLRSRISPNELLMMAWKTVPEPCSATSLIITKTDQSSLKGDSIGKRRFDSC